ncbi:MAG: type II toxin-antitoxin system HicA family toxin [Bacteroidetes bacterium]|nr:type II toxin-antitoxin system HicA family toxin [Bacteroidota bacterium]
MSNKQPVMSGKNLVRLLMQHGFEIVRIKGSHYRMKHPDGRVTTIPVHHNDDIPRGLLRKIVREDLIMDMEEFVVWIEAK